MAFPDGVTTRVISFEAVGKLESGAPLMLEAVTRASRSLVWAGTGQEFFPAGSEVKTAIGAGEVLALPPTDLSGWVDPVTGDAVDPAVGPTHTYSTTVWVYDGKRKVEEYDVTGYELPSGVDPISWGMIRNLGIAPVALSNGAQIVPLADGQAFPPATPVGAWGITVNGNESFDLFQRTEAGKTLFKHTVIPQGEPGSDGDPGADAYEVAVAAGFSGTREQWVDSLHGEDGASAYQLAVAAGFVGTEAQWRASLVGEPGPAPTPQSYADAITADGPAKVAVTSTAESVYDLYSLTAETRALIGRMSVRPNADRRNAIDTLIRGLKDNGIWAKLDALYLLAAHTSQAGLLNWKGAVASLVGVNSPTFTVDRGFKLDGATSYLEAAAAYYQALSGHDEALSVWVTSRVANDSMTDLSASLASINVRNSTSQAAWRANSTPVRGTSFVEGVPGLFQIAREDANTTKLYKDGALQDTFSTAGGSTNPGATVPFRLGVNTSKAQFSSGTYVMAAYGANLTLLQSSMLYNLLRDYMLKVGVL